MTQSSSHSTPHTAHLPLIKVGIVGGAGYTGGEAIRLLLNHPNVELAWVQSKSQAGKPFYTVHHDLLGDTEQSFSADLDLSVDVVFLCMGHGDSNKWMSENSLPEKLKIIDLSQDFRLTQHPVHSTQHFVYGLPELNKSRIRAASYIANPGCFATCIQLALLPLAQVGLLQGSVFVNATTGSTGAGQKPSESTHFSWRSSNLSVYKAFNHQHLAEITQSLSYLQEDYHLSQMDFIPERGGFARGILANCIIKTKKSIDELNTLYTSYYQDSPFVHLSDTEISLKQVVNTNKCLLQLQKEDDKLLITSVIDNLLKGASGQAVQNMNLMFGLEEHVGLKLKASAF